MNATHNVRTSARSAALVCLVLITIGSALASKDWRGWNTIKSPDKQFVAVVEPVRNPTMHVATESVISVRAKDGSTSRSHDFSSRDGEHGYVVDSVKWMSNSQYCLFRLRSSGG